MSTKPSDDLELDRPATTPEVGDEGGTPGDIEIDVDRGAGAGSEAGETWRPTGRDVRPIVRDEKGEGRRNP